MKKILVIIFFLTAGKCFSQQKFDNTIVIKNTSFQKLVNLLLDNGFEIDKIDKDFQTIETKKKGIHNVVVYARVKDSIAYITGKMFSMNEWWSLYYDKSGAFSKRFMEISDMMKPLGDISYLKK